MRGTGSQLSRQDILSRTRGTDVVRLRRHFQQIVAVLDMVAVVAALAVATTFGLGDHLDARPGPAHPAVGHAALSALIATAWVAALHIAQSYRVDVLGVDEFGAVFRATFGVFSLVAVVALVARLEISRGYVALAFPVGLGLLLLERTVIRRWILRQRMRGNYCDRALIIGTPAEVRFAAAAISGNPAAGYRAEAASVIGTDESRFVLADGTEVVNLGPIANLSVLEGSFNSVIIAGADALGPAQLRRIGWQLQGTSIRLALVGTMTDVAGPRVHRRPIEGMPLTVVESPSYGGRKVVVKRLLDVTLSALGLVVLAPLLGVIALCVHLEDRGPVLFRQMRVGINGRLFPMTKFRSMVVDAEKLRAELVPDDPTGVLFKMKDDPRITRVGKFIRAYSLDELPQLFDVLLGHMSLVGPRPPLPEEVHRYERHVNRRLNVKPGITGPWQVGGRSNLTWDQSVQKDLYYVENWSLVGDLVIMARTVGAVLRRDGAH